MNFIRLRFVNSKRMAATAAVNAESVARVLRDAFSLYERAPRGALFLRGFAYFQRNARFVSKIDIASCIIGFFVVRCI